MPHTPSPCTLHLHLNTYTQVLNVERVRAGVEGGGIKGARVDVEHVRVGVER